MNLLNCGDDDGTSYTMSGEKVASPPKMCLLTKEEIDTSFGKQDQ